MKMLILPALLLLTACASNSGQQMLASDKALCVDGYDVAKSVDPLGEYTVASRVGCRLEVDKSRAPAKQN